MAAQIKTGKMLRFDIIYRNFYEWIIFIGKGDIL